MSDNVWIVLVVIIRCLFLPASNHKGVSTSSCWSWCSALMSSSNNCWGGTWASLPDGITFTNDKIISWLKIVKQNFHVSYLQPTFLMVYAVCKLTKIISFYLWFFWDILKTTCWNVSNYFTEIFLLTSVRFTWILTVVIFTGFC